MVTDLQARPRGAQHTRAQLLDAAEAIFAERGFDATRLEDVAKAVGIRRASIVYHFRDKQTVYHAVLERVLEASPLGERDVIDLLLCPRRALPSLDVTRAVLRFVALCPGDARS